MRDEFDKLVTAGKLNRQHVDALVVLTTSGYCFHRSWGFGKITTVDTVFARFTIDFQNKPAHNMDLGFAAESLKPIATEHILARKAADLEGLRQMAALNHLDLIQVVLQSYEGRATVDQIQQMLVPDVIASDWKKWWEVAKRELRKSGHFLVPSKKSEPIVYQTNEVSLQDRLQQEFGFAKGLKARVAVAGEVLKSAPDLSDAPVLVREVVEALNTDIASYQRTQPAVALEAVFIRDDLRAAVQEKSPADEVTAQKIWDQDSRFGQILEQIPASKHRRTLISFKESKPDHWQEVLLGSLNHVPAKLCGECANLLIQEGQLEVLKATLARLISQHQANTDTLLWLAKERSDSFADILGPEVFRSMLTAMERDQFNEKRSNKLRDYILNDQGLLVELIGTADLEVIKDLTRALQLSPCFDDMDKRSLLARIVKSYPAVQSMISGDHTRHDNSLIVSWPSLHRRQREYDELVQKKVPANSKEIAIARSYGDLRENHEYKAAKEMQKLLLRRKAELESDMVRARGTDFKETTTEAAGVGTRVTVTNLATQTKEVYSILGAWDSDPDRGVVSYLTPLAQSLMNRKVGEEVDFEIEGGTRKYRIDLVELAERPQGEDEVVIKVQGEDQSEGKGKVHDMVGAGSVGHGGGAQAAPIKEPPPAASSER